VLASQQYIGKVGHVANGVVAVTSHWADGALHVPLGVRPYQPASRLPKGKADPAFATKPELAWELIGEARAAGVPFRAVVLTASTARAPGWKDGCGPPGSVTCWRCGPAMAPGSSWRIPPVSRAAGGKSATADHLAGHAAASPQLAMPWARLQLYWHHWSTARLPPELAALLEHVGHSHPLAAPT
jgi:hypothetical protein